MTLHISVFLCAGATLCLGVKYVSDFHRRVVYPDKPGEYKATTRFVLLGRDEGRSDESVKAAWFETQINLMTSHEVLGPVIGRMELAEAWDLSAEAAESKIGRLMRVELAPVGDVVSITVWSDRADQAANIANAVRDSYENFRKHGRDRSLSRLRQSVPQQVILQEAKVQMAHARLVALREKYNGDGRENSGSRAVVSREARDELAAAQRRWEVEQGLLNSIKEHSMRARLDEPLERPIELLEVAKPSEGDRFHSGRICNFPQGILMPCEQRCGYTRGRDQFIRSRPARTHL